MKEKLKPEQLKEKKIPKQKQTPPGKSTKMNPEPKIIRDDYRGCKKLKNKIALITGGDSGIGRATAVHFATEGASVAIVYLKEDEDADITKKMVEKADGECLIIKGDIREKAFCSECVEKTVEKY